MSNGVDKVAFGILQGSIISIVAHGCVAAWAVVMPSRGWPALPYYVPAICLLAIYFGFLAAGYREGK